jgi:hypothetical protein
MKLQTFELRQRDGSTGPMNGANTELLIDGKPVPGVKSVTIEIDAQKLAKVTLTAYGHFKVSGKIAIPLELLEVQSESEEPVDP